MSTQKAFIFSESPQIALELIAGATELVGAENVSAIVIGSDETVAALSNTGISALYRFTYDPAIPLEAYAPGIVGLLQAQDAGLFMIGATNKGKPLAALVAQALDASYISEAKSVVATDSGFVTERMIYGGLAVSTGTTNLPLMVVSAPKRLYAAAETTGEVPVSVVDYDASGYGARIVGLEAKLHDSVDITAASRIVCFGRGVKKQEEVPELDELASMLDAELACTRPISEDYHWMDRDRYVGLSGKSVKPKLYFVVGSSGVIQHIAGAQGSNVIVAVDSDEKAPIFAVSDYYINADWHAFLPAFKRSISKLNS